MLSDSTDEYRDVAESPAWQIGETVIAATQPTVEGLIIARNVNEDGRVDLTLIVAPHVKKGQVWTKAAMVTRDASRLSKKTPSKVAFPLHNGDQLKTEARRARAEPTWAFAVMQELDKNYEENERQAQLTITDNTESEDVESIKSLRLADLEPNPRKLAELEQCMSEVLRLKDGQIGRTEKKKKVAIATDESDSSDFEAWRKRRKEKKKTKKERAKKKKQSSTSDSSSSSLSASDSDSRGEVRERWKTGLFSCPFHVADDRGYKDIKIQVKGQAVTRLNVRTALHNFYSTHHTLTTFADKLVQTANASYFKPFASDVAWLQMHAKYLDLMILSPLEGAWTDWNEPWIDEVALGFLELIVRVSPHKEYPICLTDKVRKWMKKKRVGINPRYGPVTQTMQNAVFTDQGLLINTSSSKAKDLKNTKISLSTGGNKIPSGQTPHIERKPLQ